MTLDRDRWLVWLALGSRRGRTAWRYWLGSGVAPSREDIPVVRPRCRHCGGDLILVSIIAADGRCLYGHPLANHVIPYLDSG